MENAQIMAQSVPSQLSNSQNEKPDDPLRFFQPRVSGFFFLSATRPTQGSTIVDPLIAYGS
jgi:hypothetical protein